MNGKREKEIDLKRIWQEDNFFDVWICSIEKTTIKIDIVNNYKK